MNEELIVSDYMSAALLRAKGVPMREARLANSGRVEFAFEDSETARRLRDAHESGSGVMVNSARFTAALNGVKTLLFSVRGRRQ